MVLLNGESLFSGQEYHLAQTILNNNTQTFIHTHDFYEIFLIKEGKLHHLINDEAIAIEQDYLSLVFPHDIHSFKRSGNATVHFMNLAVSKQLFETAVAAFNSYSDTPATIETINKQTQLPINLSQILLSKLQFLPKTVNSLFDVSTHNILVSILFDVFCFLQSPTNLKRSIPTWLSELCQKMHQKENYINGLSRFILLSGKSQEYLTRMMKKHYGKTPTEYINDIKLEEASFLLKTTNCTILEVLLECGFNNVSHFNVLFKARYSLSPSRYRFLNRSVVNPL